MTLVLGSRIGRASASLLIGFLTLFQVGCACGHSAGSAFVPGQDTFAFRNELRWEYEFQEDGTPITHESNPPPEFSLHCFPMLREAREFFYHARFAPDEPQLTPQQYEKLVRQVIDRNSRHPADAEDRIIIPGYANLHDFSAAHSELLKSQCGGAWRSYLQRGNWRMVFPLPSWSRVQTANDFIQEINEGRVPIAHVYRFPDTSLNHGLLLYAAEEEEQSIKFHAYDPNSPEKSVLLTYDRKSKTFFLERTRYFPGGAVKVYEVYRGVLY